MLGKASVVCFLVLVVVPISSGNIIPLTKLKDPLARCLDGTHAGFYFQKATAMEHADSWIIHFMGGGECANTDQCDYRLTENLGSSKYWPDTVNFTAAHDDKPPSFADSWNGDGVMGPGSSITTDWSLYGWWILDDSETTNPDMHGWNHVFLPYCSQDLWSGQHENPVTPVIDYHSDSKGDGYYFSGHLIVIAVMDALDKEGLKDATTIVVSGNSAGGMGMWLHLDWMAERYVQSEVVGLSIAGFYTWNYAYTGPNAADPKTELPDFSEESFKGYVDLWDSFMDADCTDALGKHPWWCMVSENALPYVKSRVYIVQAQTDRIVLQLHCRVPENPFLWNQEVYDYIHRWHHNMSTALLHAMEAPGRHGVFSPACFRHDAFMVKSPVIDGMNFKQGFAQWLRDPKMGTYIYLDDCGEFCNPSCQLPDIKREQHAEIRHREITLKWDSWEHVVW